MTVISEQSDKIPAHHAEIPTTTTNVQNGIKAGKSAGDSDVDGDVDGGPKSSSSSFGPMPICVIRAMMPCNLHPRIERIIYWRNGRDSLLFFLSGMLLLAALSHYSLVTVISFMSLSFLTSTFLLRLCEMVLRLNYLNSKWPTNDDLEAVVKRICVFFFHIAAQIRDIVFVKSLFRTLEVFFILLFWIYIGESMDGFNLLLTFYLLTFIVPKSCELLIEKMLKKGGGGGGSKWRESSKLVENENPIEHHD